MVRRAKRDRGLLPHQDVGVRACSAMSVFGGEQEGGWGGDRSRKTGTTLVRRDDGVGE
jgi:hypothetical protein